MEGCMFFTVPRAGGGISYNPFERYNQTTKIAQLFHHTPSCTIFQRSKNLRDVIIWYSPLTLEREVTISNNPLQYPSGLYFSYNPHLNQSESRNSPQCVINIIVVKLSDEGHVMLATSTWYNRTCFIRPHEIVRKMTVNSRLPDNSVVSDH